MVGGAITERNQTQKNEMKGFFTHKQTELKSRPDGRTHSCSSCGLRKGVKSPRMKPFGNFKKGILNIGEAPGEAEDKRGRQWQGKTGRLLHATYRRLGVDLFEDCLNINAVNCRPVEKGGNNRTPTNDEIAACRGYVLEVINQYKPQVIVLLGNAAISSLIGYRWKRDLGGITKWRGWTIPDQDFNAWICPVFHPSYVERSEEGAVEAVWIQDLKQAIQKIDQPLPEYKEPEVRIITDLTRLNDIKEGMIAFDYETTGIKPQAPGHRIISAAVAYNQDQCYAFLMPETKRERQPFIDLLARNEVDKMGHNIKYEENWSVVRLRQPVQNWEWDSMLAAHVLDNRTGVTGLKFQVYVNFGVVDYTSEVDPYLQSGSKNGNALNRIEELIRSTSGRKTLLEYNGKDAVFEYRLAMLQRELIENSDLPF